MKGGDTLINKVILAGRISSDINLNEISENLQIASFFLAVDRGKKKGASESTVDFLRCKAFNRTAVNVHSFCKKGSLICITGQIHNNRYEKDGETKYSVEIVIESIKFLPNLSNNSKEKTPDEKWDEFSYEEKLMVINDYHKRKKVNDDAKQETKTVHTVQPALQENGHSVDSTRYNQRWSSELNKDEEKIPDELVQKAEAIVEKFSGESVTLNTEVEQEEHTETTDETIALSKDKTISSDDKDAITDKGLPF